MILWQQLKDCEILEKCLFCVTFGLFLPVFLYILYLTQKTSMGLGGWATRGGTTTPPLVFNVQCSSFFGKAGKPSEIGTFFLNLWLDNRFDVCYNHLVSYLVAYLERGEL